MEMTSAAVFLAGSVLYALAGIIILVAIVVANNILHKYWKSFGWQFFPGWISTDSRFVSQDELNRIAPTLEKKDAKHS